MDVIGSTDRGWHVLHDGRIVTPLGLSRGMVDLAHGDLARYGIVREGPPELPSERTSRASAGSPSPISLAGPGTRPERWAVPEAGFAKRASDAPSLPGAAALCAQVNHVSESPAEIARQAEAARDHFAGLLKERRPTTGSDSLITTRLLKPILNTENARNPGLNAMVCGNEDEMLNALRVLPRDGKQEGHVRFHLSLVAGIHSVAVDAYRHGDGGFTLLAVDSISKDAVNAKFKKLTDSNPGFIHGSMVLPSHTQVHEEGCRIFATHALLGLNDYAPYAKRLHEGLRADTPGGPPRALPDIPWNSLSPNCVVPQDPKDTFKLLPPKFFKHIQGRSLLSSAEERNPALATQAVNKDGKTLRERFAGLSPEKTLDQYDNFDRTRSLNEKRVVYLERTATYYRGLD
jgi:hypothetical protein